VKSSKLKAVAAALLVMFGAALLVGCSGPTATATDWMCIIVKGDGKNQNDASFKRTILPGEKPEIHSGEKASYVPCGPRNYIINPSGIMNANGKEVGDRHNPSIGKTKDGTAVKVWTKTYWELNQGKEQMQRFDVFCSKYNCSSDQPMAGDANSATKGWNDMLGENFGDTVDQAVLLSAPTTVDDNVIDKDDPAQYAALSKELSTKFTELIRKSSGYSGDLFCGTGGWNGNRTQFDCTSVSVEVTKVERVNQEATNKAEQVTQAQKDLELNVKRLEAARKLYGADAEKVLAQLDTIEKCGSVEKASCVINLGGNAPASVSVPVP